MGISSSSLGNVGLEDFRDEKLVKVALGDGLYDERVVRRPIGPILFYDKSGFNYFTPSLRSIFGSEAIEDGKLEPNMTFCLSLGKPNIGPKK
eukprot:jgi/Bigna1/140612/aug1.57_g15320